MASHGTADSALAIAASVRSGAVRAREVTAGCLRRIATGNAGLFAFVETFAERALARAEDIDRARERGAVLGPLAGVPVALKDNLLLEGQIAACGSRMLERFVSPLSSTVAQRLEAAGAVVVGRTNMDEFGMGNSTERSAFGQTRNPWDRARVPGGSSGGAAAAVAAGMCPVALGSDTGGSVRQPAALCGVTGLKPTYGRLSRHGLVAYASSLDCVGVLAADAADVALAMAIAGADPADATSQTAPVPDFPAALTARTDLAGLRIGCVGELDAAVTDPELAAAVDAARGELRALGAELVPVRLPTIAHAIAAYYLIAAAEASSNLARYDGVRFGLRADGRTLDEVYARSRSQGFGAEVQLRILLGTYALQHGYRDQVYGQATRVRALLRHDFAAAFAACDLIACATSPVPPWPLGAMDREPVAMYRCDALTVPASLAGLPALSLPCGFTAGNLPIGLQLIGAPLREDLLLQVGHVYQQRTGWHRRRPPP